MTTNDDQNTGTLPSKISRRTLAAGAAWSVPVIAVASAAPAYALSGGEVSLTGESCKHSGKSDPPFDRDYHFVLLVKNTTGAAVEVCITDIKLGGTSEFFSVGASIVPVNSNEKCFTVPSSAGATGIEYTLHVDGSNSANTDMTVYYTYDTVPGDTSDSLSGDVCTYECSGQGPNRVCP